MKKFFAISAIALALTACGGDSDKQQTAQQTAAASTAAANVDDTIGKTVYRVRSEGLYEPFITRSNSNQIEGFDYDLLKAIGEKQGFVVKFEARPFSELFSTLDKGDADIVSSGLAITDERKQQADPTEPYFEDQVAFLAGKNVNNIQSLADIKGKNISVQAGSPSEVLVNENGGIPVEATSTWLAVKPTIAGETPATFGDAAALSYYVSQYPNQGLHIVPVSGMPTKQYAFYVKKGNTELLKKLNEGLAQLKADGTYEKIRQKWFSNIAAAHTAAK